MLHIGGRHFDSEFNSRWRDTLSARQSAIPMTRQRSIIASQVNGTVNYANIMDLLTPGRFIVAAISSAVAPTDRLRIGKKHHLPRSHARINYRPRFTRHSRHAPHRYSARDRIDTMREDEPVRRVVLHCVAPLLASSRLKLGTQEIQTKRRRLHAVTLPVMSRLRAYGSSIVVGNLAPKVRINTISIYGTTNRCLESPFDVSSHN